MNMTHEGGDDAPGGGGHDDEGSIAQDAVAQLLKGEWTGSVEWVLAAAVQLLAAAIRARCDEPDIQQARTLVRLFNDRLHFELTCQIAEAWQQSAPRDMTIGRRHAQALINLRELDLAEGLIKELLAPQDWHAATVPAQTIAFETTELRGLLGRIAKDRFVRATERNDTEPQGAGATPSPYAGEQLQTAIDRYRAEYDADETRYWHGINTVALLTRQQTERAVPTGAPDNPARTLAARLVAMLSAKVDAHRDAGKALESSHPGSDAAATQAWESRQKQWVRDAGDMPWILATLSEAHLALDDCDAAELWLSRFINLSGTRPFDLGAYARQLVEIWRGDPLRPEKDCASRLAHILSLRQQAATQGLALSAAQARDLREHPGVLEKNFSGQSTFSVATVRHVLRICEAVGCVSSDIGRRIGTGFLIERGKLWGDDSTELVFVTNAHVISDCAVPGSVAPKRARIQFEMDSGRTAPQPEYRVGEVLYCTPPRGAFVPNYPGKELDLCVVTLDPQPSGDGLELNLAMPKLGPRTKVYVVGHPLGRGLQISLHDSLLLAYDGIPRLIHYRTPTEPGSSGSPVFNEDWEVIGVHHAGTSTARRLDQAGTYEANEGIALAALCRTLKA
ncbi:serine protease [Tahibacter sp.]|uniref:serine protease n=1 Tax=Tahibacter sp. TaxID=2056211 RepID=UPI0028C37E66|nr:serine protease [Tahibacter sp.]